MEYSSVATHRSEEIAGVSFTVRKVSLGGRLELARRIRQIGIKREFHAAGGTIDDDLEVAIIEHEINRAYLEWGLVAVSGLQLDGAEANTEALILHGPEKLTNEILGVIRRELSLSEEERKN